MTDSEPLEWCGKTTEPPKDWDDTEWDYARGDSFEKSRMYVMPPKYDPLLEKDNSWQGYQRTVTQGAGESETKVVGSKYSRSKRCAPDRRFASCEQYLSVDSYYKVLGYCKYHRFDDSTPSIPTNWDFWEKYHFNFIWWRVRTYGY